MQVEVARPGDVWRGIFEPSGLSRVMICLVGVILCPRLAPLTLGSWHGRGDDRITHGVTRESGRHALRQFLPRRPDSGGDLAVSTPK